MFNRKSIETFGLDPNSAIAATFYRKDQNGPLKISLWQDKPWGFDCFNAASDIRICATDRAAIKPPVKYESIGGYAITHVEGEDGGHVINTVGYDDNICIDINNNDNVDEGEMGAL